MSAEQIRDSVLAVSGALDTRVGGPSKPLTPLATRRTIYGRVSRYKLDEFLQLFDFPSPSQTAEQRFATNVPLQRLFFMNSDFMQQHAERLAERVADEPDDRARIEKVYRIVFGRAPTADELKAGLDFLQAEAFKQTRRSARGNEEEQHGQASRQARCRAGDGRMPQPAADKPEPAAAEPPDDDMGPADGMMSGVTPGRQGRRRREEQDAAGHHVRPVPEDPLELERVHVRELIMSHRGRPPVTRREALCRIGSGFGMLAFAGLVSRLARGRRRRVQRAEGQSC